MYRYLDHGMTAANTRRTRQQHVSLIGIGRRPVAGRLVLRPMLDYLLWVMAVFVLLFYLYLVGRVWKTRGNAM